MRLKNSQIEFIESDLRQQGVLFDDLREDLVDHICSEVEQKMDGGMTFMDAYHLALQPFKKKGLPELNEDTVNILNSFTMIRSYVLLAFRNISRYKVFSAINILGLSLGMAACFIILQYVAYEFSFDTFHPSSSSVYRITDKAVREGGESFHTATTFLPLGRVASETFPEIEDYNRLYFLDHHAIVSYGNRKFEQEAVIYADANFFQFFSYDLIKGNPATVIQQLNTVAMSESAALRYFDNQDPIGKIIQLSEEFNDLTLQVTGIFKDPPPNSHLRPQMVVAMAGYENIPDVKTNEWRWPIYMTYVRLRPDANPKILEAKLPTLVAGFLSADTGITHRLSLQPLEDIHLFSALQYEIEPNGKVQFVLLLLAIAVLTLVIAYANYINLSTARSLDRAKEVGIRKTLGSNKRTLLRQFIAEAFTVNFIALALAIVLVRVFTLLLLDYAGISIEFSGYNDPVFWIGIGTVFVAGALLSSWYPALVLSSFQPVTVLRGKLPLGMGGQFLRRTLVAVQFGVSIALMIASYAIYNQLQYMRSQPLGMNIDNLVVVKGVRVDKMQKSLQVNDPFVQRVTKSGHALNASASNSVPGTWTSRISNIVRQGSEEGKNLSYNLMGADESFIETYQLELLAGRNFKTSTDTIAFSRVLVNERAASQLGYKSWDEAVNSIIEFRGRFIEIIGVVKDYHHYSLKSTIDPMLIFPIGDMPKEFYTLRIKSADEVRSSLALIEEDWKATFPDNPFEYFFLDSSFDAQYKAEVQFEKVFMVFTVLAVFIACLGLYGLASFIAQKRSKEIGIRKILGSSVRGILILLSWDFMKLILLSGIIALPLAFVGVQSWQSQFAFRDSIPWWLYLIPMVVVLVISLLTISVQTIKVALINPVEILKYD